LWKCPRDRKADARAGGEPAPNFCRQSRRAGVTVRTGRALVCCERQHDPARRIHLHDEFPEARPSRLSVRIGHLPMPTRPNCRIARIGRTFKTYFAPINASTNGSTTVGSIRPGDPTARKIGVSLARWQVKNRGFGLTRILLRDPRAVGRRGLRYGQIETVFLAGRDGRNLGTGVGCGSPPLRETNRPGRGWRGWRARAGRAMPRKAVRAGGQFVTNRVEWCRGRAAEAL
jgi:hypothetical protein